MPEMDGPTTLQRIREIEAGRELPVVFITARAGQGDTDRLMQLGAAGVIGKPFDHMARAAQVRAYLPG